MPSSTSPTACPKDRRPRPARPDQRPRRPSHGKNGPSTRRAGAFILWRTNMEVARQKSKRRQHDPTPRLEIPLTDLMEILSLDPDAGLAWLYEVSPVKVRPGSRTLFAGLGACAFMARKTRRRLIRPKNVRLRFLFPHDDSRKNHQTNLTFNASYPVNPLKNPRIEIIAVRPGLPFSRLRPTYLRSPLPLSPTSGQDVGNGGE
jgi:hypothetical protein